MNKKCFRVLDEKIHERFKKKAEKHLFFFVDEFF